MKKTFIFFLLLFTGISHAQKKDSVIQVSYKVFFDTDVPVKADAVLYVNQDESIYQHKTSTTQRWTEKPARDGEVDMTPPKGITEPYYKIDKKKEEIFFFDSIFSKYFFIQDNYSELPWQITRDTKKIAGYNCVKALVNFRGRVWEAWFAPEIPLSFGPWKLHGLPGLILEAYDTDRRYAMIASEIQYTTDDIFKKDFAGLVKTLNKSKPISFEQYINNNEEAWGNRITTINNNRDVTVTPINGNRNDMELKFEWEEE